MTKPIKATRPCTIQDTDSNRFVSFPTEFISSVSVVITGTSDFTTGHIEVAFFKNDFNLEKVIVYFIKGNDLQHFEEVAKTYFDKVLNAIASAQRPWLKAKGFKFKIEKAYSILTKTGSQHLVAIRFGGTSHKFTTLTQHGLEDLLLEDVIAFKPISDSQEAWDALAGVEVYKEPYEFIVPMSINNNGILKGSKKNTIQVKIDTF